MVERERIGGEGGISAGSTRRCLLRGVLFHFDLARLEPSTRFPISNFPDEKTEAPEC
jgi:hypothetical protein